MGISVWQLLIILAIVLLLFGAKRLRNLGGDLGTSVKGFREAMKDGEKDGEDEGKTADASAQPRSSLESGDSGVIDGEVVKDKNKA